MYRLDIWQNYCFLWWTEELCSSAGRDADARTNDAHMRSECCYGLFTNNDILVFVFMKMALGLLRVSLAFLHCTYLHGAVGSGAFNPSQPKQSMRDDDSIEFR